MKEYHNLGERILNEGVKKADRTGTGTYSVFGHQMRFDLQKGFPLVNTKDMSKLFRIIVEELRWFLAGSTNLRDLLDVNVNIWNADAYRNYRNSAEGEGGLDYIDFTEAMRNLPEDDPFVERWSDLGRIYGVQWRSWYVGSPYGSFATEDDIQVIDQITELINGLRNNPDSRRHIVTAWNPAELNDMVLPPCHVLFQFYVADGKLSCQLYQRSVDYFLGLPFNIASYALLTHMVAEQTGYEVGEFIHTSGDAHIYLNHVEQVKTQLAREPYELPKLIIKRKPDSIFDYATEDFELEGYQSHGVLKGQVSAG